MKQHAIVIFVVDLFEKMVDSVINGRVDPIMNRAVNGLL